MTGLGGVLGVWQQVCACVYSSETSCEGAFLDKANLTVGVYRKTQTVIVLTGQNVLNPLLTNDSQTESLCCRDTMTHDPDPHWNSDLPQHSKSIIPKIDVSHNYFFFNAFLVSIEGC